MSHEPHTRRHRSALKIFGAVGLVLIAMPVILGAIYTQVHLLVWYLLGVNLTMFAFYGYDKYASRHEGRMRIPECVLHLFAFIGGTPAALLGRKVFHHKTLKRSFRIIFWLVLVIQIALITAALHYIYVADKAEAAP